MACPIHTATPGTTKLSCLRRVRFGGVNWIPDNSRLSPTGNLRSEHVQSNRRIHIGRPDTTQTGPSCRVWCGGVNWARHLTLNTNSNNCKPLALIMFLIITIIYVTWYTTLPTTVACGSLLLGRKQAWRGRLLGCGRPMVLTSISCR